MRPAVRTALRWVMLVALLVLALLVALGPVGLGPRDDSPPDPAGAGDPAGPPLDLARLRAAAALQPCPTPSPVADPVEGPLSGVELPCLGAPGTVDVGAALAGRPALLNLWGPLCRPCVEELPALAGYAAEPGAIPVLGVEVQQLPEGALDLLTQLDVHYPSVSDPEGELRAALGAPPVLPLTYVVAADGRVSLVDPPEVLRSPQQVKAVIERYLDPGTTG